MREGLPAAEAFAFASVPNGGAGCDDDEGCDANNDGAGIDVNDDDDVVDDDGQGGTDDNDNGIALGDIDRDNGGDDGGESADIVTCASWLGCVTRMGR